MFSSHRNNDSVSYIAGLMLTVSLNALYIVLLYVGEVLILIYKGYYGASLHYEVVILLVCLVLDVVRIAVGVYNLSGSKPIPPKLSAIMVSLLTLPIALGYLYFMLWQAHIFIVERIMYTVALIGVGAHTCLSHMI